MDKDTVGGVFVVVVVKCAFSKGKKRGGFDSCRWAIHQLGDGPFEAIGVGRESPTPTSVLCDERKKIGRARDVNKRKREREYTDERKKNGQCLTG